MDILTQTKLTRAEWESIEIPVSAQEKRVLKLIQEGYDNINITSNISLNMIAFTKLPPTPEIHAFIYDQYFKEKVHESIEKAKLAFSPFTSFVVDKKLSKKIKKSDSIRITNISQLIEANRTNIYEFECMVLCKQILKMGLKKGGEFNNELYTLIEWRKTELPHTNPHVLTLIDLCISYGKSLTPIENIVKNAHVLIEKNPNLNKYENQTLFSHQKELFAMCRKEKPKLILYTAPTGTGKTLSPLGLANNYKVIFVCVARHVGLSLAKSAISVEKKIAFAFGCEMISDVKLHYYSAIDFEKNRKTGGIWKVDHSNGKNVEMIICDVQSYLFAMRYLLAFNEPTQILTYWDEPTMTLDYKEHALHSIIKENWSQNMIPNIVLSCATLPHESELQDCIQDFRIHFEDAMVCTISSYDCKKSIPMLTSNGYSFMPHIQCDSKSELSEYASFCTQNKTLLRYFDLEEIIHFILLIHHEPDMIDPNYKMDKWFEDISQITMSNLKLYYLKLLIRINEEDLAKCRKILKTRQQKKYPGNNDNSSSSSSLDGVRLTTKDAYSLTDGPTIYLTENILNLAKFYIQQSEIPESVLNQLTDGIQKNDSLFRSIRALELDLEKSVQVKNNSENKTTEKKPVREKAGLDESTVLIRDRIQNFKSQLFHLSLNPLYIPNSKEHQQKWSPDKMQQRHASFTSNLSEQTVKDIMGIQIPISYKVLILMGVGVLVKQETKEYEEIVKRLAEEQKLFLILASSDYIYGTNYQFCHGIIGKDLQNMTPQKIIQVMGRIGRNQHQQDYTIRFRDDQMIHSLFRKPEINMEALNMNRLLCHD